MEIAKNYERIQEKRETSEFKGRERERERETSSTREDLLSRRAIVGIIIFSYSYS